MTAILMITTLAMAVMLMIVLPIHREPAASSSNRGSHATPADHAARLLAARYARGEISAYDYQRVREVLYS